MNNPRRLFLKVIAAGPLVACSGAGESTAPEGSGGSDAASSGGPTGNPAGASTIGSGGSSAGSNAFVSSNSGNGGFNFGAGGTGSSFGGATGAAGTTSAPPNGRIAAGSVSSIAVGSLAIVAKSFLLGRDAQGIYAMSLQCTHQGCAVDLNGTQLLCPCHKSRFDSNGNVLQGPAVTPLPHFAVFVDSAGNVSVDMFTKVSGSTRTLG